MKGKDRSIIDRIRGVPATADSKGVVEQAREDVEIYGSSGSMVERYLLKVRNKYTSQWDREMLEDAEKLVRSETSLGKALQERETFRRTATIETDTSVLKAENARLFARQENQKLARSMVDHEQQLRLQAELEAKNHRRQLLEAELRIAELEQSLKAVSQQQEAPLSAEEKKKREITRWFKNVSATIENLVEWAQFAGNVERELATANVEPGSDTYEHAMNLLDALRQRIAGST